ncbi:hypothetical protein LPB136_02385 [Tenacibaculum todarodis]|uniref:Uncharacterized protein n=1 Tax=Tenacibaculum todarodis TaxID=1850252 RepID=A0A1L3JGN0_9FLAO|nr:hypothetical protein [Tenacibaculum todarodis]APG64287.1 hypothetical protein LPB136_02385 [Tenacibaculum todarodis]
MKKIFLILILLTHFNTYSQSKKIMYVDEDLKILTIEQYKSNPLNKRHYEFRVEKDSVIFYIKAVKEKFGRISKEIHEKIKNNLITVSNSKINSNQTIIINYFPKKDKCLGNTGWNNSFLKLTKTYTTVLKEKKNIKQFFIFKDDKIVKNFSKEFQWYKDNSQLIEKTFFKFHYPCFSYVIIKPNGNYYTKRGEYRITEILEKI